MQLPFLLLLLLFYTTALWQTFFVKYYRNLTINKYTNFLHFTVKIDYLIPKWYTKYGYIYISRDLVNI